MRADRVRASAVLPGRGFAGAGDQPPEFGPMEPQAARGDAERDAFDPRVALCEEHPRPRDYARDFAARARSLFLAEPAGGNFSLDIVIGCRQHPDIDFDIVVAAKPFPRGPVLPFERRTVGRAAAGRAASGYPGTCRPSD